MSKKERLEYLEAETAGLHEKLAETIRELEELKKQIAGAWLIKTTPSSNTHVWPTQTSYKCNWCGCEIGIGMLHYCPKQPNQLWNPNGPYVITVSNKGELK